ncbi:NADH-quinone oxidoreductase subunit NuoK, partial [bacterium]
MSAVPVSWYLLLAAVLFAIGAAGALTRRNGIAIFLSVELMLNAANLSLVAYARQFGEHTGQVIVF